MNLRLRLAVASLCLTTQACWALPSFAEVKAGHRSSETQLLDRDGVVIQRLRTDATVRRGLWLALGDVSPALRQAIGGRALVLGDDFLCTNPARIRRAIDAGARPCC